jgi:putative tricarboxylic transport membrane protein
VFKKGKIIAIFWVLLGLIICYKSYYLDLGKLYRPGPGFMPFIAGLVIAVLGLISLFISYYPQKKHEAKQEIPFGFRFHPLVLILLTLITYSILFDTLGYLISTFLLMLSLFSLSHKKMKWWFIVGGALLITFASYLVFDIWLRCSLPKGVFGI